MKLLKEKYWRAKYIEGRNFEKAELRTKKMDQHKLRNTEVKGEPKNEI